GNPVVINTKTNTATIIDADTGQAGQSFGVGLRPEDTVSVSGSPDNDRVYLVASRGLLIICDIAGTKCSTIVPLIGASTLGTPVEAADHVFVPDYSAGQVWVVDLKNHSVVARSQVLAPGAQFQLLNRDGVVFFNDPQSEQAGVIQLSGQVVPAAKYDA